MLQLCKEESGRHSFCAVAASMFGLWSIPHSFSVFLSAHATRKCTGLTLAHLPPGFRYSAFGWTAETPTKSTNCRTQVRNMSGMLNCKTLVLYPPGVA